MDSILRKSSWFLVLIFCTSTLLWAQNDSLLQFNEERLYLNEVAMIILGSWAIANMLVNGFLLRQKTNASTAHFYKMNIFWNIVNLGLAIPGFRSAIITLPESLGLIDTLSAFYEMSQILLLNAGLDVAYITGGFLLLEMAKRGTKKQEMFKGYGKALLLQGGFLLVFDVVLVMILQTKTSSLHHLIHDAGFLKLVF